MKNTFQDLAKAEEDALEGLKKAQQHIAEVKQQKEQQQKAEIQAKKDQRNKLIEDSRKLLDEAAQEAKSGNLDRAMALREFAADSKRQSEEIVIEGEQRNEETPENSLFGQGMPLGNVLTVLGGICVVLYLLCGYINHLVELGEKSISISVGAEWIHAIQTTEFWALCWMMSFGMMYLVFRSISQFINPKKHPEHDLTTKLFTECTPYQQIAISLGLLLSFVLSWCLIYLHNPVSNAG